MSNFETNLYSFNPPVAPYLSLVTSDFIQEKAYLYDTVFPHILSLFKERNSSFNPIYVKWTADNDQAASGHGLTTVLNYIRRYQYLIALVGARYGPCRVNTKPWKSNSDIIQSGSEINWVEKNIQQADASGYKCVNKQEKSIQHIEIEYGAFHSNSNACYFYFRQPEHLNDKQKDLSGKEKERLFELYQPATDEEDIQVRSLKQTVVNKGLRVKYFATLNELGRHMIEDWMQFLEYEMPFIPGQISNTDTEIYESWVTNETFAIHRQRHFIKSPAISTIIHILSEFCVKMSEREPTDEKVFINDHRNYTIRKLMRSDQPPPTFKSIMVLGGVRGSGKSAIIANWIGDFKVEHPDIKLLYVYIGSSHYNCNLMNFLWAAIKSLRKSAGYLERQQFSTENRPRTFEEMREMFISSLQYGPCVLVIDDLNDISGDSSQMSTQMKQLSWLPCPLPGNCAFIVTTGSTDITHSLLAKRGDTIMLECPSIREPQSVKEIMTEYMGVSGHLLTDKVQDKFREFKMMCNPLILCLLANEIASHSVPEEVLRYLNERREITSLCRLWASIVIEWTRHYSWPNPQSKHAEGIVPVMRGWVADAITLIALSRTGLLKSDILAMLRGLGYTKRAEVKNLDWIRLRMSLGEVLEETPDGRLFFSNMYLQENTLFIFLGHVSSFIPCLLSTDSSHRNPNKEAYHQVLASHFSVHKGVKCRAVEYPYHLAMAGNLSALKAAILDIRLFKKLTGNSEDWPCLQLDLDNYCNLLKAAHVDLRIDFTEKLISLGVVRTTNSVTSTDPSSLALIEGTLSNISDLPLDSFNFDDRQHERYEAVRMGWLTANMFVRLGHHALAQSIYRETYAFITNSIYPPHTEDWLMYCHLHRILGDMCAKRGDIRHARVWYKRAMDVVSDLKDLHEDTLAVAIDDLQGDLLSCYGDLFIESREMNSAMQCFKDAQICWNLSHNTLKIAESCIKMATIREESGDYQAAEHFATEALIKRERWYGHQHLLVSHCLYNLGRLKRNTRNSWNNMVHAEKLLRDALSVAEATEGKSTLHVANILKELGKILRDEKGHDEKLEALAIFRRAVDISNSLRGSDHEESIELMDCVHQLHTHISHKQPEMWRPEQHLTVRPQSAMYHRDVCRSRHRTKSRASQSRASQSRRSSSPSSGRKKSAPSSTVYGSPRRLTDVGKMRLDNRVQQAWSDHSDTLTAGGDDQEPLSANSLEAPGPSTPDPTTPDPTTPDPTTPDVHSPKPQSAHPKLAKSLSQLSVPTNTPITSPTSSSLTSNVSHEKKLLHRDRMLHTHPSCVIPRVHDVVSPPYIHGPHSRINTLMSPDLSKRLRPATPTSSVVHMYKCYPESTIKRIITWNRPYSPYLARLN